MFLLAHDSDEFNRWEAGQELAVRLMQDLIEDYSNGRDLILKPGYIDAMGKALQDPLLDKALLAEALLLPSENYMAELADVINPQAIHAVRQFLRQQLASRLQSQLMQVYQENASNEPYRYDAAAVGRRRLRNQALSYLMELGTEEVIEHCLLQYQQANNMTETLGALMPLANSDCAQRIPTLEKFYRQWSHEPLVVNKWLVLQSTSRLPDTLDTIKTLLKHPAFEIKNPNKVRALIGAFVINNPVRFHDETGAGYIFLADQIMTLDPLNPQVTSRLAGAFNHWHRFDARRQGQMQAQLQRIIAMPKLSKDVYEIVSKALKSD